MKSSIPEIAKKAFGSSYGYPSTAATTGSELKRHFSALLQQAKDCGIDLDVENLSQMLYVAGHDGTTPGGAIKKIAEDAAKNVGASTTKKAEEAKLMAIVLNAALTNAALTNDEYKVTKIAEILQEKGFSFEDATAALNQQELKLNPKSKFNALQELYPGKNDIDYATAAAWRGLLPGTTGGQKVATSYYILNKRLEELKATEIELTPENLSQMLNVAGHDGTTPGGAIEEIAEDAFKDLGASTTKKAEEAKLMAIVLNTALTNDEYKVTKIANTLKERGVAFKDVAAALNQQELMPNPEGRFNALQELYPGKNDIDYATAVAWRGLLPGTTGGPKVVANYYSLNRSLEELKATGIELTPENLSRMLDVAGHDGTTPGGAIEKIEGSAPGSKVKLISKVLNDFLVDENDKHEIISGVLNEKGLDLKTIDINLPKLYGNAQELQDAQGYQKLYKDAVDYNHITKDNIDKFTAALVQRRRDQAHQNSWGGAIRLQEQSY